MEYYHKEKYDFDMIRSARSKTENQWYRVTPYYLASISGMTYSCSGTLIAVLKLKQIKHDTKRN